MEAACSRSSNLEGQVLDLELRLSDTERQLEQKQEECEALTDKCCRLEAEVEALAVLAQQKEELEAEKEGLEESLEELQAELENTVQAAEAEQKQFRETALQSMEEMKAAQAAERETFKVKLAKLGKTHESALEDVKSKVAILEQQASLSERQVARKNDEIVGLQEQLQAVNTKLENIAGNLSKLSPTLDLSGSSVVDDVRNSLFSGHEQVVRILGVQNNFFNLFLGNGSANKSVYFLIYFFNEFFGRHEFWRLVVVYDLVVNLDQNDPRYLFYPLGRVALDLAHIDRRLLNSYKKRVLGVLGKLENLVHRPLVSGSVYSLVVKINGRVRAGDIVRQVLDTFFRAQQSVKKVLVFNVRQVSALGRHYEVSTGRDLVDVVSDIRN